MESNGEAVLRAIGAGAINQAVKGMAVARGLVAPGNHDLKVAPEWATLKKDDGSEVTALRFRVFW